MPKQQDLNRDAIMDDDSLDPAALSFEQAAGAGYDLSSMKNLPATTMVEVANGALRAKGYLFSPTSLTLPDKIPQKEWREVGRFLRVADDGRRWWIGDWCNRGNALYGEMYSQAIEITGYKLGTLQNFAYVASRVQSSLRSELLTYKHHIYVAPLEPEDQEIFLKRAIDKKWSSAKLKAEIDDWRANETQKALMQYQQNQAKERSRIRRFFVPIVNVLSTDVEITEADYQSIETQLAEMLAALRARVKQDESAGM